MKQLLETYAYKVEGFDNKYQFSDLFLILEEWEDGHLVHLKDGDNYLIQTFKDPEYLKMFFDSFD